MLHRATNNLIIQPDLHVQTEEKHRQSAKNGNFQMLKHRSPAVWMRRVEHDRRVFCLNQTDAVDQEDFHILFVTLWHQMFFDLDPEIFKDLYSKQRDSKAFHIIARFSCYAESQPVYLSDNNNSGKNLVKIAHLIKSWNFSSNTEKPDFYFSLFYFFFFSKTWAHRSRFGFKCSALVGFW